MEGEPSVTMTICDAGLGDARNPTVPAPPSPDGLGGIRTHSLPRARRALYRVELRAQR
jgi:hypothetical protein